jgi:transposase InsO family protein
LPRKVFSDLGSQFISGFMAELYRKLGIKMNPSTAFHPQTDGQTEWVN